MLLFYRYVFAINVSLVIYGLTCYIHEKLCIFVYNGLNSHECTWIYMYFLKLLMYMYFCSTGFLIRFVSRFLTGSGPVLVPRVDRFDHQFGFDNIDDDNQIPNNDKVPFAKSKLTSLARMLIVEHPTNQSPINTYSGLVEALSLTFYPSSHKQDTHFKWI